MRKILIFLLVLSFSSQLVLADDNANSGNGGVDNALKDKGYYRTAEYMYKVSVYVGLKDDVDENSPINSYYKMVGNEPIFIKPTSFELPNNLIGSNRSKIDYLNGKVFQATNISSYMLASTVPRIPITNYGNINSVKSYFGDANTLNNFITEFAEQRGTTREQLVSNIQFTIEGEKGYKDPNEILPIKKDGVYQNRVPWLIVYEPVTILYLKPDNNGYRQPVAFTASDYAITQKMKLMNYFTGTDGQYVYAMTHSDLPNSIVLEENWVGLNAYSPLADNQMWSNDRIIQGGGIGMRMLKPEYVAPIIEEDEEEENEVIIRTDETYRVDTDVITSFTVTASEEVTPDARHLYPNMNIASEEYAEILAEDKKAYVTISANGNSTTKEVVLPAGGSREVWLKWHTPSSPTTLEIEVSIEGNPSATIGGSRNKVITASIVDLNENIPPDPRPEDKMPRGFRIPNVPNKPNKTSADWRTSSVYWEPKVEWVPNLVWVVDDVVWVEDENDSDGGYWKEYGDWVDQGWNVDKGHWVFEYQEYEAILKADINVVPDEYVKTAKSIYDDFEMKSGYGINMVVTSSVDGTGAYTQPQTSVTYFPEFEYEDYWRLLDKTGSGKFEFPKNIYSTYYNRVHFTPLPYPDGDYEVLNLTRDAWTPGGELYIHQDDLIKIKGNLYQDWQIVPVIPE